jgi:Skp family chaperone for outer membrane proteins
MRKLTMIGLTVGIALMTGIYAQAQVKIGVVDTLRIANDSEEGKRAHAALKVYHEQKQVEITAKESELKALEEKIKDPKFAEEKKDEYRSLYNQKLYEYQAFARASQEDMDARTQKQQAEFQKKLEEVINRYAVANGYHLVLEMGLCLANADSLDLTNTIMQEMNQAYPGR